MIEIKKFGSVIWVELNSPETEETKRLVSDFSVDPLLVESLLEPSHNSKIEYYSGNNFILLSIHFPDLRSESHVKREVDFIVGKSLIVTSVSKSFPELHEFAKISEKDEILKKNVESGPHMFVRMLRLLLNSLEKDILFACSFLEHIEDHVFAGNEKEMVVEMSLVSKKLIDARRSVRSHLEILPALVENLIKVVPLSNSQISSINDDYKRIQSIVDDNSELLQELRETNNSLLSTKQNSVMQALTVMSFIALPLTLIASLLQIDIVSGLFLSTSMDFLRIIVWMSGLAFFLAVVFRVKRWI